MRVLFITRKYPPQVGGMEQFSEDFVRAWQKRSKDSIEVIALNKSQIHLVWWVFYAFFKGIVLGRKADVIHIGDGVLAWLGVKLKWFTGKPITITVHGLDVTYKKFGYQALVWSGLKHYDHIVGVSEGTIGLVKAQLGKRVPTSVITNGIFPEDWSSPVATEVKLPTTIPANAPVLLTVGRLIKRKGVAWFVQEVMPLLPQNTHYCITSSGPELSAITAAIQQQSLSQRVHLLGRVSDNEIKGLYKRADLFIMPNIAVKNDVEGFGIVAIEASASGLPVMAAKVPGIRDAVVDGTTGFLVESSNRNGWKDAIIHALEHPKESSAVQSATFQRYDWDQLVILYRTVFNTYLKD